MAQLAVGGPLGEPDLRDEVGPDPVRRLVGLDARRERATSAISRGFSSFQTRARAPPG